MPRFALLIICILVSFLPALSAVVVRPDGWYQQLVKPAGNPPPWVFGPVWSTLYLLIGIAAYLALKTSAPKSILALFTAHLILNTAWSLIFFGAHHPLLALVDILLLDGTVALLIFQLWSLNRPAALCLLPYQLWILYATYLNTGIVLLNKTP